MRPTRSRTLLIYMLLLASGGSLFAHGDKPDSPRELWHSWAFDPGVVVPIVFSAALYVWGVARFWRRGKLGRGIRMWEAASFAAGWLALVIALVSPLHPWGRVLFSAHMTQHELLMLVAAPLLVLGRPLVAFLKALPGNWSHRLVEITHVKWWRATWHFLTYPFTAWVIHAAALWIWHIPALFDATLDHEWVHALQHTSFLGSALLFWWAVMQGRTRLLGYGMAVIYMFTTALHSGLLGVLITFAKSLVYPGYSETTAAWGLTPLEDQQLGGLIMWVPAGLVYIIAGLAFFTGWLRASEQRALANAGLRETSVQPAEGGA